MATITTPFKVFELFTSNPCEKIRHEKILSDLLERKIILSSFIGHMICTQKIQVNLQININY